MTITETPEEARISMLGPVERRQALVLFAIDGWHDSSTLRVEARLEEDADLNGQMIKCLVGEVMSIGEKLDQMTLACQFVGAIVNGLMGQNMAEDVDEIRRGANGAGKQLLARIEALEASVEPSDS